ncbi:hypothetical protein DSM3645_08477 [Blastopirellula marina DSM 3645]|uniref:Uncharacterized protein n=1 Tax=Blastopirellula marina DSM 3645 TaxID=314230 RepID=A3ZKY6_9BACT|nr:hypothetical protein DSM3645_08477 [Blastopirellula marina DSM 3645]
MAPGPAPFFVAAATSDLFSKLPKTRCGNAQRNREKRPILMLCNDRNAKAY